MLVDNPFHVLLITLYESVNNNAILIYYIYLDFSALQNQTICQILINQRASTCVKCVGDSRRIRNWYNNYYSNYNNFEYTKGALKN